MERTGKKDASIWMKGLYGVCNSLASLFDDISSVFVAISPNAAIDPVLVCLTTEECNDLPATFKGFKVVQKPFYPNSTKSFIMAEIYENEEVKFDTKMFPEINETINYHAESLMTEHRNLIGIKMSLVRSSKKRIKHEPCIVLLCRGKAFVPIGESEFPTHLGHPSSNVFFRTDVREGFFKYYSSLTRDPSEWSSELAMGCSKGPENDGFSASLRPFINIEGTNQLYFLTVRHLIKPLSTPDGRLSGVNLVPPFDSDYCVSQVSWNNCRSGVVKVALLNDKIDAALVDPTRAPTTWNSLGIRTNDLDFADKVKRVSDDDGWESDDSCKFDRSIKKVLKSKPWNKHKSKARAKTKRLFKRRGKKDASNLLKSIYGVCNSLASLYDDIASVFVAISPAAANDPVLVCLTTGECNDLPATFKRFKVIQKPFYPKTTKSLVMAESDENEEFRYDTKIFQEINETINYHAGSLMTKHTNLEAIKMSLVRSSKNVIKHEPCIVLLCRCKSYIPIGEPEFPKKLGHPSSKVFFPTDVREGYFKYCSSLTRDPSEWSNELAMGCSIGPENDGFSASLGPFINIQGTNQLCFLTVRHLFQPLSTPDGRLSGVNVVQPSDSDYSVSQVSWNNRRCGVVKVALLNDKIDAALVEIDPTRAPNRGKFVGIRTDDLDFAGFTGSSFPTYDDGCVRDARKFLGRNYLHDRIIKFGKKTGLRKGFLSIENLAARIATWTGHIRYGSRIQSRVMYQQLQVDSLEKKVFFEVGDSGAAVFSVDKDDTLFCIGMAIGTISDNTCVVTPIQNILEILGQRIGQTLELKTFLPESMDIE